MNDSTREEIEKILDEEIHNGIYEPDYNMAIPRILSLIERREGECKQDIAKRLRGLMARYRFFCTGIHNHNPGHCIESELEQFVDSLTPNDL